MPTTDNNKSGGEPIQRIEREAADWLVQRDRGFTPRQKEAFESWKRADFRHAEAFSEIAEGWGKLDRLRVLRPEFGEGSAEHKRRRIWIFLSVAAAAVLLIFSHAILRSRAESYSETASTEAGTSRTIELPDGSIVRLSPESTVSVVLTTGERRVQLKRGEANFQVAKNPSRPFIVSAGRLSVRAVGTVFDVHLRTGAIEVAVTEGKVRVDDVLRGKSVLGAMVAGAPPLLLAGQKVIVSADSSVNSQAQVTSIAETDASSGSQGHRMEFVSVPLSEIVTELNRFNQHKLVIADSKLAALRFGGTFFAGDDETLVRMLESNFSVTAERRDYEIILRLSRP